MLQGKLFIGYDYCIVYGATDLTLCFKCCSYHHTSRNFKYSIVLCPLCEQNHDLKDCPKTSEYCTNCHKHTKTTVRFQLIIQL